MHIVCHPALFKGVGLVISYDSEYVDDLLKYVFVEVSGTESAVDQNLKKIESGSAEGSENLPWPSPEFAGRSAFGTGCRRYCCH